ncbi:hypothetical protein GCM10009069_11300 [Algimonas arctica]|uniref:Sel1 repeat family protein n=1 Tax=Algimonas arctica TaxID=1479486 RepID=A0A8J3CP53_9PROT|nr:hypothetical protein [Algimonas arctica]GHA89886.1 hypothetical protein GCM10009069_11300 [Algimonas arctica]
MTRIILLSFVLILSACQADTAAIEIENRFEQTASEDVSSETEVLRECADNPECKTQDSAQFELAVTILSDLTSGACEWAPDQTGGFVPVASAVFGVEDDGPAISLEEWVALGPDQAKALLDETSLLKPFSHKCDYDDQSADFRQGYDLLVAASAAGNHDAANELGVLYLDDPDMFDLDAARSFLETCNAFGGGFCAFNLARVESLESVDGCGRCLGLLRVAATRTGDGGIRFMYGLAKRRLDRGELVGRVFINTGTDSGTQEFLEEFEVLFPRLALDTAKPDGI